MRGHKSLIKLATRDMDAVMLYVVLVFLTQDGPNYSIYKSCISTKAIFTDVFGVSSLCLNRFTSLFVRLNMYVFVFVYLGILYV